MPDTTTRTKSDPVTVTFDAESWPHVLAALHTRLNYVAERAYCAEEPLLKKVWAARRKEVARALVEMESAVRSTRKVPVRTGQVLGSASV